MKYMKRIVLVLICVFSFSLKLDAQTDFRLTVRSRTTQNVMGVQHQKLVAEMRYDGVITNQQINYIGANPSTNPNISLVATDNFTSYDFNRGTLLGQFYNTAFRYPDQTIVAGVNGDFFDINSTQGQNAATAGPHIRDGNVVFEGYNRGNAYSVGIRTDGQAFIERLTFQGYHIEVVDDAGSVKQKKLPVKINALPANDDDLVVLLPSFSEENAQLLTGKKMIINTNETIIHRRASGVENGRYFVKGYVGSVTEEPLEKIEEGTMVLVGNDFFLEDLITSTDLVKLHNKLSDQFSDVYQAVSGNTLLVNNGVVLTTTNKDVHPRTAAGLKEDGTVFFVTVDGRQAPDYVGVTLEQLGEIMKYFGAVKAFNLDGGGSTTVAVLDTNTESYVVHNSPSDGYHRQDANGVAFIAGERYIPLAPIPYPDTRTVLSTVNNAVYNEGQIKFSAIDEANKYVVMVGDARYTVEDTTLDIDLEPGNYDVTIQAFGNHDTHRQSEKSDAFVINIFSQPMQSIVDHLLGYGQNTHNYLND